MFLIGQYDSPFVRRVGIALRLYGMPFEHRPWSTFGDAARIAPFNPLLRVPTLVLDDGEVVIDSAAILDWLDERAGPDRALIPRAGDARRRTMRIVALGTGLADKAVSLFYERALHGQASDVWVARCRSQIGGVLDVLERERSAIATPYWFGPAIGHADITMACALRFLFEAHAGVLSPDDRPALREFARLCEARREFQEISQAFQPPA
ncbi:MAG: glutathione S-transferase family protein [Acetobacteraceae bacterium]